MNNRLLPVIALVVVVLIDLVQANRTPDCSAIMGKSTFELYEHVCVEIADPKAENAVNGATRDLTGPQRLDVIETCACNLVSHELAFSAMMTQTVEALYLTIKKYIDEQDDKAGSELEVNRTSPIFSGPDGLLLYYWDRLPHLLGNSKSELHVNKLSDEVVKLFSEIYYDPVSFSFKFKKSYMGHAVRMEITTTCLNLFENVADTFKYLKHLRLLSKNEHFLFRLALYNNDLYKIRMVLLLCQFLQLNGQLIHQ